MGVSSHLNVAADPTAPPAALFAVALQDDEALTAALIANPATSDAILRLLFERGAYEASQHPNLDVDWLLARIRDDAHLRSRLRGRLRVLGFPLTELMACLNANLSDVVYLALVTDPVAPEAGKAAISEVAASLSDHPDPRLAWIGAVVHDEHDTWEHFARRPDAADGLTELPLTRHRDFSGPGPQAAQQLLATRHPAAAAVVLLGSRTSESDAVDAVTFAPAAVLAQIADRHTLPVRDAALARLTAEAPELVTEFFLVDRNPSTPRASADVAAAAAHAGLIAGSELNYGPSSLDVANLDAPTANAMLTLSTNRVVLSLLRHHRGQFDATALQDRIVRAAASYADQVLTEIAERPEAGDPAVMATLRDVAAPDEDSATPPWDALTRSPCHDLAVVAAARSSATAAREALAHLDVVKPAAVRAAIARNPAVPLTEAVALATRADVSMDVWTAILSRTGLDERTIAAFHVVEYPGRCNAADTASPDGLRALATHPDWNFRRHVLRAPVVPDDLLDLLRTDTSERVRKDTVERFGARADRNNPIMEAGCPDTPVERLGVLARSRSTYVRFAVAANPAVSAAILDHLLASADPRMELAALSNPALSADRRRTLTAVQALRTLPSTG